MNKKHQILLLALLFAAAGAVRVWFGHAAQLEAPKAENGILDLRGWSFGDRGPVALNGEWRFEPGVLSGGSASGSAPATAPPPGVPVRVPGGWEQGSRPAMPGPFGHGTYRLRVLLPAAGGDSYALRVRNIRSAHTLSINGREAAVRGRTGTSRSEAQPHNLPYVAEFKAGDGGVLELAVAVSNYRYGHLGGIFDEIRLGPASAVHIEDQRSLSLETGFALLFAVSAFLLLFLYLFRRRNGELLAFSLLLFFYLGYWLTHGHKLLFAWLPGIGYDLQTRLQLLVSFGIAGCFYLFLREVYGGRYLNRLAIRLFGAAGLVLMLFSAAGPVEVATRLETVIIGLLACVTLYLVGVMVAAAAARPDGALYTVAGAFCLLYNGLFQGAAFMGIYPPDGVPPYEIPLFLLSMAILMGKRFFAMLENEERLTKELRLADRLKNDFLANTSHELRGPLHGMINLAQTVREDWRGEKRQEERMATIVATGRRLLHVLDEMLDLTKLNEGAVRLQPSPVDVRMSVTAAMEVMSHLGGGRLKLENRVPAGLPYAWADAHRLMQILFNLLHLAEKPGTAGTAVVEAAAAGGTIAVTVRAPGDWAGPVGDPAADGPELAICRRLVELHGGTLAAADEAAPAAMPPAAADGAAPAAAPLAGVRFTLTAEAESMVLPQAPAPGRLGDLAVEAAVSADRVGEPAGVDLPGPGRTGEPHPEAAAGEPGRQAGPASPPTDTAARSGAPRPGAARVLAASGDEAGLRVTAGLLEGEGLDVTTVPGGRALLAELDRASGWDLVVLDVMLPDLSGYDVCREIRRRCSFYDLPVLFLTSRSQPADLLVGAEAGGNDFVAKPLDVTEFTARVRTLLRLKQAVRDKLHMEMALIQAQIRPHFLFNTLNTIASLSESDPERMRDVLAEFGHYLRSSFDMRNLERFVPFENEWALVESYLYIEQARFGSRIRVEADVPDDIRFALPPLTVQPLVENALRHGILKRPQGGTVSISVCRTDEGVRVTVGDDGAGFPQGRAEQVLAGEYRGGIGLTNIHRRLTAYYGAGLRIASEPGRGSAVSFLIPTEGARMDESDID